MHVVNTANPAVKHTFSSTLKATLNARQPSAMTNLNGQWTKYGVRLSMLAPVVTGILNPVLLYIKYRREGRDPKQRRDLVMQEASNQTVAVVTHLACFIGLTRATVAYMNKKAGMALHSKHGPVAMLVGGLGGLFAAAVVRPLVGAMIFKRLEKGNSSKDTSQTRSAMRSTYRPPLQRIGQELPTHMFSGAPHSHRAPLTPVAYSTFNQAQTKQPVGLNVQG